MYAIVDCNNFFVSCERVFNPKLRNVPLAVLSNGDGCIIARSNEVKARGIPMGAPLFKWKHALKGALCLSSNFALYGDMSNRVMCTLEEFGYPIEFYSIDEAFMEIDPNDAPVIAARVYQCTGIPVSIGVGPTKTLAKVANKLGKKAGQSSFLFQEGDLDDFPIGDVWGIGRRYREFLEGYGILTAGQLIQKGDAWIKKHLKVVGLRTVWELRGRSCIPLEGTYEPRKSIISSRTFSREVDSLDELKEAIASFVAVASKKLRKERLIARYLSVYIRGKEDSNSLGSLLPLATAYTPTLSRHAHCLLSQIFRKGCTYKKAGVMLSEFASEDSNQFDLFSKRDIPKEKCVMELVDTLNVHFASEGITKGWRPIPQNRSPNYTTSWDELPRVFC